jgi:hypothetical protein
MLHSRSHYWKAAQIKWVCRVSHEERSIFWEVTVSVILSKNYICTCVLFRTVLEIDLFHSKDPKLSMRKRYYVLFLIKVKRLSYSCNRPWRPIGLWDVQALTFSRQSAHRWRWRQPYTPAALYPPRRFLVLISVRGCLPQGHSAAGMIRSIEKKSTSSGLEPATFRLAV